MRWNGKERQGKRERKGKDGAASDNQTAATPKYIIDRGWGEGAREGEDGGGRGGCRSLGRYVGFVGLA